MRAVLQRVTGAAVRVERTEVARIGVGLVVLLAVGREDTERSATWLAEKVAHLRVFEDNQGRMAAALTDVQGAALVVPQFTLYGDARKGRRPDFTAAAGPPEARRLFEHFVVTLRSLGIPVKTGHFGARMLVEILNDGPVTLIVDSPLVTRCEGGG